jgi:uncharacterized protein involved in outer membrane biogenesis
MVLEDVALTDGEGQPALRARRLEARYRLSSLLSRRPRIDLVRGEGLWVRMRVLDDGRFNLATLARPRPRLNDADFAIERVVADGVVRYEAVGVLPGAEAIEAAESTGAWPSRSRSSSASIGWRPASQRRSRGRSRRGAG